MAFVSSQLDAFSAVVELGSFSKAAKKLFLTQSALSQRILNLEGTLNTALLIRDPKGLRLTTAGSELLRYCQVRENLEEEVLKKISSASTTTSGVIRIAGFSSVMRSVIMPSLKDLLYKNSEIHIELINTEIRELPSMLTNNQVDFIVTGQEPFRREIESHHIGDEINVLISKANEAKIRNLNIYLDHDEEDTVTEKFLRQNPNLDINYDRRFLDEVYGLIDGVKLGWGKAVVPRHLVRKERSLKVEELNPLIMPVHLQYFRRPFYGELHKRVVSEITSNAPRILNNF